MAEQNTGLRFQNKVAIVTGGCVGIGRGCADILAEHGGHVVVFDIQDEVGQKMKCDGPGQFTYMHCDMFKEEEIKKCIAAVIEKFGHLDCVVNNVGMHTGYTTIEEQSVDDFRKILNLNVVSQYIMYKYALPHLRKTKGCVVNMSSAAFPAGIGGCPTYCCTKGAIPALAKALAIDEAKHGVRINTILPGVINTPMLQEFLKKMDPPGDIDTMKDWSLFHRVGEPRDIALTCLYLVADAPFTTGADINCTGGCELGLYPKP